MAIGSALWETAAAADHEGNGIPVQGFCPTDHEGVGGAGRCGCCYRQGGKSTKGKNWSIEEDDLLVAAWVHTSLDALIETDQTSNSYWGRIYDYYSTRKKVSWPQILNRNQSRVTISQQHPKWENRVISKGPQKKQKKTSDASPGTTSNDKDFERCTDALETETRPDGNKREKTHLQKAKASASDAFSPNLSLENVWAQKLEKAEVKVTKRGRCHTSNLS
ncbi:hypothetical protein TRIUR3_09279 [Triticum urartu]|uniref:No apical meristem-associated C-terminal domain-containing protein n=1 Tax=Triticum urartu TaxID=4572 RepID=M7ZSS9_TRIUA|nr:hypothetical protein TRIUR3_09279 [Triticum urartu]